MSFCDLPNLSGRLLTWHILLNATVFNLFKSANLFGTKISVREVNYFDNIIFF